MDKKNEEVFDKWCNRYMKAYLIVGEEEQKGALYTAFEQGFNRGYSQALKESQTSR